MTYAIAPALQAAVFGRLAADGALAALVGPHVYDSLPPGAVPPLYVALGPETARDRSDATDRGAEHDLSVAVVSEAEGFAAAKAAAAAVCDALLGADLDGDLALGRGRLVLLRFLRAQATRPAGGARRIDLTFRARVEDGAPLTP